MIICQAHKLKNADSGLSKSLNSLPARKRVLLSGTPMQNELSEFFNMVLIHLFHNSYFFKYHENEMICRLIFVTLVF
jgi:DNA repair and recombination RAD54-like protein